TARRQALQAQHANLKTQVDHSLTDLMHAPETNWLFRGKAVQEALDRYFKDAEDFLQTQFELTVLERAIAVVVAAQEHAETWTRDIESFVNRVQAIDGELVRRLRHLKDELLAPAKTSGLALIDQAYLDGLYQAHVPSVPATLDALLTDAPQPLHRWIAWSRDAVQEAIVSTATRPFDPIRKMTVEQVIQDRTDRMSARQWADALMQKARPAWNLNEVLLPGGAAHLARVELLGVPDREGSIYAGDAARLVTALRRYPDYLRGYRRVRGKRPLHILPRFLADGQSAKLAFALGHLFGFITDRGVYYYYQPLDELVEPVKLGRGKENAIQALGSQACTEPGRSDGLVREVMQRVEARIEDIGYDQAQQELAAFHAATGNEDELARELKRLVRDYAEQLQKQRLA
ncbi:MAG: hypothetical protein ACE5K7_07600, partial [Phycisphaerae bacterium]